MKDIAFWDIRRWGLGTTLLNDVHMKGIKPTKTSEGTYEYKVVDCDAGSTRVYLEKIQSFSLFRCRNCNRTLHVNNLMSGNN